MTKRAAQGAGTIRKKIITRNGKQYTYWEARVTIGRNPGTGKQIQKSFTGKTQKEVREKMQAVSVSVNDCTYQEPVKMMVGEWLDIWTREYLGNVKDSTRRVYMVNIRKHIAPALGAVKLLTLRPHMVQNFVNGLTGLSGSSVRLAYRVLRQALEKAVELGYIPQNPARSCVLPRVEQKEIHPLTDEQATALLRASSGSTIEHIISVALFTGLRLSEVLGLTWDAVEGGTIVVSKQLARPDERATGLFLSPKNGKTRTITPAASVLETLKRQRRRQMELQLKAGALWNNPAGLVFTLEDGAPVDQWKVEKAFKDVLDAAGVSGVRFHDLRHTYAVNAIRAGDDIKTVQGNLGHATAAFTLDRYGHFTERMKQDSAARMEGFIKDILNL